MSIPKVKIEQPVPDYKQQFEMFLKTHGWKIPPYPLPYFKKILDAGHLLYQASQTKDLKEKARFQNEAQHLFS